MIQVLPFQLGEGQYGLELSHIQEVIDEAQIYYLPGAPQGVLGAVNLHGRILPVLDLPMQFGFESGPRAKRMIVTADQDCPLVLAVCGVQSVLHAEEEEIKSCQTVFDKECVTHILDHDGRRIRLVDLKLLRDRIGQLCEPSGG